MKKKIALLLGLTLGFTAISCSLPISRVAAAETTNKVTMYRLYNPNSGEHFYTGDGGEKTNLVNLGWRDEGIGWIAPAISDSPVYRLYNGNSGDHHYTIDANEKNNLVKAGWKDEGIGWYSDDEKTIPLYREYNPNAVTGTHNYTADKAEHNNLVKAGWKDEGIGWYAVDKKPLEIGDTMIFGAYEQDNNTSNGKEEIEWKVLAKEGDKVLVISKYALDCQPFNTKWIDITWEICSLRKWLNETFISNAFSSDEQDMIQTTNVIADKNPEYDISPGNNTKDKVFLLSIPEANRYFSSVEARMCAPTEYAKAQGVSVGGKATGWWWLRTPGEKSNMRFGHAAIVDTNGNVVNGGTAVSHSQIGVRPAMWIKFGQHYQGTIETLKYASVGDIVKFGAYEQDNNTSNGKEEIEWKVLAKKGDKALVISRYALDCQPFNTSYTAETWETCTLRKWLNETFISNAFSSDEQDMIQTTNVTADMNPEYDISPGNNTKDKVFLLSIPEANRYFISDEARMCAPTEYAKAQGVSIIDSNLVVDGKGACSWWLRSPGCFKECAADVWSKGCASVYGDTVDCPFIGVRPAMWINLGS